MFKTETGTITRNTLWENVKMNSYLSLYDKMSAKSQSNLFKQMNKLSQNIKYAAEQTKKDIKTVEWRLNNVVSMKQEMHRFVEPKVSHLIWIEDS